MPPMTQARWLVLRRLFESGALDLDEIAHVAGVTVRTVRRHARRAGWVCEPLASRAALIDRLWQGLALQVNDLGAVPEDAADHRFEERDARTLSALIRAYEKLDDLDRARRAGTSAPLDLDALRAALAERLEALAGTAEDGASDTVEDRDAGPADA